MLDLRVQQSCSGMCSIFASNNLVSRLDLGHGRNLEVQVRTRCSILATGSILVAFDTAYLLVIAPLLHLSLSAKNDTKVYTFSALPLPYCRIDWYYSCASAQTRKYYPIYSPSLRLHYYNTSHFVFTWSTPSYHTPPAYFNDDWHAMGGTTLTNNCCLYVRIRK